MCPLYTAFKFFRKEMFKYAGHFTELGLWDGKTDSMPFVCPKSNEYFPK